MAEQPRPDAVTTPGGSGRTTCAVVGGGPAGLMLGLLLARAGVTVTVLEKHGDFLRDFRGDTVHPTTLTALQDLGLFPVFEELPHSRLTQVSLEDSAGERVTVADFGRLREPHPYIAMVPQWDLLNLLARAAGESPHFTLLMEHEVTDVMRDGDRVSGVRFASPEGRGELSADLVVACDGRHSTIRRAVGLPERVLPVTFDVWWFKVTTEHAVGESLLPRLGAGTPLVAIPRRGYVQIAYLGPKGDDAALRRRGVEALRADVASALPELARDVGTLASMADVKHLDVRVDRLRRWSAPGVLCIGDAAHAMSPVGGVGINLAVQDAIAAARILAEPLRCDALRGPDHARVLERVRRRRWLPTALVQTLQRVMHRLVITPAIAGRRVAAPDRALHLVRRWPVLTGLLPRVLVVGPRPERVPRWAGRGGR